MHSSSLLRFVFFASAALAIATPERAHARGWKPKFENRLTLMPSYYFEDVGQGTSQWTEAIVEAPELSVKPNSDLKLKFAPWFYADPAARSVNEHFIADVNEAALDKRFGDFNLKLGINSVAWGVTDVFNPLDVVSSRRYIDPLNSEKRGVPSAILSWDNGTYRADALFSPVQFDSILPGENSRWLPRDITFNRAAAGGQLILADQFQYTYEDKRVLDNALNANFGARVERHGSGLDLTAIFFQGAPTAPAIYTPDVYGTVIDATNNTVLANRIGLQPVYYLRQTAGVGAVITLETAIIRFEAANSVPLSTLSTLPGWAQSAVLGIEKNFSISDMTLTTLLQATAQSHQDSADNTITSLDRIFDRSLMLGFRLSTNSDWTWTAAGLFDSAYQSGYAQLRAERKITDGLTAAATGDWLDGVPGSPLGTYRRNKRVTLQANITF